MNFPNHGKKSTQAVARLIEKSGGPIDYLRISKLIYLADRESIIRRGIPIVGGHYYSMRKGPTISEVMNFVNRRNAPGWCETISARYGNEVRLQNGKPQFGALSESEIQIIDLTVESHSDKTTEELVVWCHENCPEYEEVQGSNRKPIKVESILSGLKNKKQIQKIVQEAQALKDLDTILA